MLLLLLKFFTFLNPCSMPTFSNVTGPDKRHFPQCKIFNLGFFDFEDFIVFCIFIFIFGFLYFFLIFFITVTSLQYFYPCALREECGSTDGLFLLLLLLLLFLFFPTSNFLFLPGRKKLKFLFLLDTENAVRGGSTWVFR